MEGDNEPLELYKELKRLAFGEPKKAREFFCKLLDSHNPYIQEIFSKCGEIGESRVRHVVANALRDRHDKGKYADILFGWLDVEADEFTARALIAALDGLPPIKSYDDDAFIRNLLRPYQYVSERLSHRVRNSLPGIRDAALKLFLLSEKIPDSELKRDLLLIETDLNDAIDKVMDMVAFDPGNGQFDTKKIELVGWVENFAKHWNKKGGTVNYGAIGIKKAPILASEFLLRTIFTNLWLNAVQAVGIGCDVTIDFEKSGKNASLTVIDSGRGFSSEAKENVFESQYSTKQKQRGGQGLLEVMDGVDRLRGRVALIEWRGSYRLQMSFPLEGI